MNAVVRVLKASQMECYCDVGHYYCPCLRPRDNALIFPSGILCPDGRFEGAARLFELLQQDSHPYTEDGHIRHYPHGTPCGISTIPNNE